MARTKRIQTILLYVILTLGALVMILPFYWMVATSLKSGPEAISVPPTWLPRNWLFSNYGQALEKAPFGRYFLNSVFVTTVTTAGELFTSILAAYAFAKLKFWGKDILFLIDDHSKLRDLVKLEISQHLLGLDYSLVRLCLLGFHLEAKHSDDSRRALLCCQDGWRQRLAISLGNGCATV